MLKTFVIIATAGVLLFIVIAVFAPFKNSGFLSLFPKSISDAFSDNGKGHHGKPSSTPTSSPVATPNSTSTPQPTLTPSSTPSSTTASSMPAVSVPTSFATSVPLQTGDFSLTLGGGTSASLNTLASLSSGINKLLAYTSITDMNSAIGSVPSYVNYIAYDFEPGTGYTPSNELTDPLGSVTQFAQTVHAHGKKMVWVPTYGIFDNAVTNGTLKSILANVDVVVYQSQKLLTTESNYTSDIQNRYHQSKAANPNVLFYLQLWVGTNGSTDQQIINGFNGLVGYFDIAGWGGGTKTDTTTIYSGLSWRK